jgi:hypothetical protein
MTLSQAHAPRLMHQQAPVSSFSDMYIYIHSLSCSLLAHLFTRSLTHSRRAIAALPDNSPLQKHASLLLGLRTGFCGSLTTFASWVRFGGCCSLWQGQEASRIKLFGISCRLKYYIPYNNPKLRAADWCVNELILRGRLVVGHLGGLRHFGGSPEVLWATSSK